MVKVARRRKKAFSKFFKRKQMLPELQEQKIKKRKRKMKKSKPKQEGGLNRATKTHSVPENPLGVSDKLMSRLVR